MTDGVPLLTRRSLMQSGAAGLAIVYGLSGCGDDDESSSGGGTEKASGTVSFGSNYSDPVPKGALQEVFDGFQTSSGITVDVNTVDHNTFQEQINNYLQGTPDDVFTWFAGYRMQFFAERGLATDISDVWEKIGGNFSDAFKQASTGLDGKQYFIPFYNYPWAIFYRKSVWEKNGYEPAANLDDFKALCEQIKKDGMTPIAFGDKDGWPAMGTFDYINMRTNGYDFHKQLMAGEAAWDGTGGQDRVRDLARAAALPRRGLARPHVAGRGADAQQGLGDVPARLVRRPAVRGRVARGPRLLRVPGDQLRARAGRGRGADRRLHALQGPEERGRRQGAAGVPCGA